VASAIASVNFEDSEGERRLAKKEYFGYPISKVGKEGLEVPFYFIGNVEYLYRGMGIISVEEQSIFEPHSFLTLFVDVERVDRLYYESNETKRAKEENIQIDLILLDRNGNKIDEMGYEGPSWDRSGHIFKTIKLNRKYDYLKLISILSSKERGEIQKKEIEYFAPERGKIGWFDRIKEIVENNWVASVIAVTIILASLVILITVLVVRRKKNLDPGSSMPW